MFIFLKAHVTFLLKKGSRMNHFDDRQHHKGKSEHQVYREERVYGYLLEITRLVLAHVRTRTETKYPPISSISNLWDMDRMFVQRVLQSLYTEDFPSAEGKKPQLPGLTLDRLVHILIQLKEKGKIKRSQITEALRLFTKLSHEEQKELGINANSILFEELVDRIDSLDPDLADEITNSIYHFYLSLDRIKKEPDRNNDTVEQLIKDRVTHYFDLLDVIPLRDRENREEIIDDMIKRVKRKIEKIHAQSGGNVSSLFGLEQEKKRFYPNAESIDILSRILIENVQTAEKFSIRITYIEVNHNQTLPLFLNDKTPSIDRDLYVGDRKQEKIENIDDELENSKSLYSHTVRVHFYIKLKLEEELVNAYLKEKLDILPVPNTDRQYVVKFFEEVSGSGSPISHVISAIDRVLFWDIPCLDKYEPMAKNILSHERSIGNNPHSPILSHNVVCLFKKDDVKKALKNEKDAPYKHRRSTDYSSQYAIGEYCGFDIIENISKSAILARLRAILKLDIDPEKYSQEIVNKIYESQIIRNSEEFLNMAPFSMSVMQNYIEFSDLKKKYFSPESEYSNKWSMSAYNAILKIIEGLLAAGLFEISYKYLNILEKHIEKLDLKMKAKYYTCKFRYYYLNCHSNNRCDEAKKALKEAEDALQEQMAIYEFLDVLTQSSFYESFYILSTIKAHKAETLMFLDNTDGENFQRIKRIMWYFEEGRIFAAKDGHISLYSTLTAYQSWFYFGKAYLSETSLKAKDEDLFRAEILVNHALFCYSEIGQKCYESIKSSGGGVDYKLVGRETTIDPIPFISEYHKEKEFYDKLHEYLNTKTPETAKNADPETIPIDMSVFCQDIDMSVFYQNTDKKVGAKWQRKKVYIFGMQSAILLFACGMMKLCKKHGDDSNFQDRIEEAKELFIYSWSIAEEGLNMSDEESYKRKFKEDESFPEKCQLFPESYIGGLYPHRLTEFADFGKIYTIACNLILLHSEKKEEERDKLKEQVNKLIEDLCNNPKKQNDLKKLNDRLYNNFAIYGDTTRIDDQQKQKKYNEHLESIYNKVKVFAEEEFTKTDNRDPIKERDTVVKTFFEYLFFR
jgi:hypothetical protein